MFFLGGGLGSIHTGDKKADGSSVPDYVNNYNVKYVVITTKTNGTKRDLTGLVLVSVRK